MPSRHRCFLLTPTENIVVTLRRVVLTFEREGQPIPKCTHRKPRYPNAEIIAHEVHDIEIEIAREVGTIESCIDGDHTGHTIAADDPRWPTRCACGHMFAPETFRQECRTRLYKRSDTGELVTLRGAPVGALYDSGTFRDVDGYTRNGDRMSLVCKTPAGEWLMDGPASNGPGWSRSGTPPDITVTPSIGIGNPQRMHGVLTAGWLEIDTP